MKKIIALIGVIVCSISVWSNVAETSVYKQHRKEMHEYRQLRAASLDDLISNPLPNTIAKNQGDTIVELISPRIGNQGSQGSCNAWAMGYGCGSIHAYSVFQNMDLARRSPAFLFNLNDSNCINNSSEINKIGIALRDYGVCAYNIMPYDSINCHTYPDSIQLADAALNKMEYTRLNSEIDINEYKQILRAGYPIAVGTWYLRDLRRIWNTSSLHGFWESISDTSTVEGHAMCMVGYNDSINAFKVMNSWDSIKGDHGFVWVSYNLVQNGVFNRAYVFEPGTTGNLLTIEGPSDLTDSAWYYVRNLPQSTTVTWNLSNIRGFISSYTCVSAQGVDSMYIANRPTHSSTPIQPPGPIYAGESFDPNLLIEIYHLGYLTATISYGNKTYTTQTKIIKELIQTIGHTTSSRLISCSIENADYTLELWHSIYGRMKVQTAQSVNEQIDIHGLPQGVYVVLLKENDTIIAQKKIILQ